MKKVLLNSFILLFIATVSFSQAVVISSPPSLAGSYTFGIAQFGPDITTDVWCADLVLIQDGSSNPTLGCDPNVLNAAAIAGKFVVIDRGSCNFSLKAFHGQMAGAIGAIIINNVPGAGVQVMGAGTNGADVTIPTIMLSFEDGERIKTVLAGGTTVSMCFGNIKFNNNVSTNNRAGICHAPFGTYPYGWIKGPNDYVITPGAYVTNKGLNISSGVEVNARITYTPLGGSTTEVYNKTSDGTAVVEVDSTRLITLEPEDMDPHISNVGKGNIHYVISSDSLDDADADNAATSEFHISRNILSKARTAANGIDPFITSSYRRADGTNAEFITGFKIPYCAGCRIDSILFNMSINAPATLAGITAEANLYGWDDLNGDGDATNNELSYLAVGSFTFDGAETRTSAIVRVPLQDFNLGVDGFTIPIDNFGLFVGVRYGGTEATFFGFDETMDYVCDNEWRTAAGILNIDNLPYLGITAYDPNTGVPDVENAAFRFTGLNAALAVALVMQGSVFTVDNKELNDADASVKLYPNPAKEKFFVETTLTESTSSLQYKLLDNTGRVISQSADNFASKQYTKQFNVQNLENGVYHVVIKTDKGFKQITFEVLK